MPRLIAEIPSEWHPVVQHLIHLLDSDSELKQILEDAICRSRRYAEPPLECFYSLIHRMQTTIPNPQSWLPMNLEFYYVLGCALNNQLFAHPRFAAWLHDYTGSLGQWMDTEESLNNIDDFINDPLYAVGDAIRPENGWSSYNDFFARRLKPGLRPISAASDDAVIVSAADSSFCGHHQIRSDSTVVAKGLTWSVIELLDGSSYAEAFKGGFYGHSFLAPHNYHRFHAPVAGRLLELRTVMARVAMDVHEQPDGKLSVSRSAIGYQFHQQRGIAILDTAIGLVGVIPIGMGIVSSVTFTAKQNSSLKKGEELGYFAFGGSDVVLLFQKEAAVDWQLSPGDFRQQGQAIAYARMLG